MQHPDLRTFIYSYQNSGMKGLNINYQNLLSQLPDDTIFFKRLRSNPTSPSNRVLLTSFWSEAELRKMNWWLRSLLYTQHSCKDWNSLPGNLDYKEPKHFRTMWQKLWRNVKEHWTCGYLKRPRSEYSHYKNYIFLNFHSLLNIKKYTLNALTGFTPPMN